MYAEFSYSLCYTMVIILNRRKQNRFVTALDLIKCLIRICPSYFIWWRVERPPALLTVSAGG